MYWSTEVKFVNQAVCTWGSSAKNWDCNTFALHGIPWGAIFLQLKFCIF